MALISLIHPSRGRAEKSLKTTNEWYNKFGHEGNDVELIVSLDNSDIEKDKYIKLYEDNGYHGDYRIIFYDNKSVVEATNKAAEWCRGDIIIYLSDDFSCPPNWGALVLKEFEGEERPLLLKVDDCLQRFEVPVLTIPMMNRKLYETLGYFWHPGYRSMFVDEDLYWSALKLGAIKNAPHLKFEHQHVSVGKAQDDETYRNSAKNWDQGKEFFKQRRAQGFPL